MTQNETTTRIYYLATKTKIIGAIKRYYAKQGFELIPYQQKLNLETLQYILLIEPLAAGQNYYSVSRLWKQWLMLKAPHVHLCVAALAGSNGHSNFMSLLELPKKLADFLKQTQPVSAFQPIYLGVEEKYGIKQGKYQDPWEISLPHTGEPAKVVMDRFLHGHDKTNSFFEQLTRLRKAIIDLESAVTQNKPASEFYSAIEREYHYLLNRWYRYHALLPFLPFQAELSSIFVQLKKIKAFLDTNGWKDKKARPDLRAVEKIRDILKEKIVPVVHAEDYW